MADFNLFVFKNPHLRNELTGLLKTGTKTVDTFDTKQLKINGTAITKTAAEINALDATLEEAAAAPVNAIAAQGTLAISGVVVHGETVEIGAELYEFNAALDDAGALIPSGNIDVDITAAPTIAFAQGTLTMDTQPTAGDTMTLGTKTYDFVPDGTANADGEITVGTDLPTAKVALVAAVNGTDGHNDPHPLVYSADFIGDGVVITAFIGGVTGNTIDTTETFTAGTNIFDAATLGTTTAGVDAVADEGGDALEAAITANSALVTAAYAAPDLVATAAVAGVAGDDIALDENMANGVWDDVFMGTTTAGVDGTEGEKGELLWRQRYIYLAIDDNTIADDNWRRIDLGAAAY